MKMKWWMHIILGVLSLILFVGLIAPDIDLFRYMLAVALGVGAIVQLAQAASISSRSINVHPKNGNVGNDSR